MTIRTLKLFVAAALLLGAIPTAYALSAGGIGIYPTYYDPAKPLTKAWFIYENIAPGETHEDSVTVSNTGTEPRTVLVYAADSTINNKGSFALESREDTVDAIGSWVTFLMDGTPSPKVELTLQPGATQSIPFRFSVPADLNLEPGEHAGAIVTEEKTDNAGQGGLFIATRVGVRIYYTVPGEVTRKLSIAGFTAVFDKETDLYQVQAQVKNEGNVTMVATGRLHSKQLAWGEANTVTERELRIPPHATREVDFAVPNPLWGKHGLAFEATYTDQAQRTQSARSESLTFWAFPWKYALFVLMVLALNVAYMSFFKIRRALARRNLRQYTVAAGDTVASISEKFGMKWKHLISLNHIRKPYSLTKGQKLLVHPIKSAKGTREAAPQRAWATVTVSGILLVLALGSFAWSAYRVTDLHTLTASVLSLFE